MMTLKVPNEIATPLQFLEDWPHDVQEAFLNRIDTLIAEAFEEDVNRVGDITSQAIFSSEVQGRARIFVKSAGVVAGLFVAEAAFRFVNPALQMQAQIKEGQAVQEGQTLLTIDGPVMDLLKAERTALNFLGRLSGIATRTSQFVQAVAGTKARILDTRKTTPGWRLLEKYAVRQGGGMNHRLGLFDMVLIKENHIQAAGGITSAVEKVRRYFEKIGRVLPIEVEVRNLVELEETLPLQVNRILLDNMNLPTLRKAVELTRGRVPLEASGGVTLSTVRGIAQTGVDFISVGALTHSAPVLDLSMLIL